MHPPLGVVVADGLSKHKAQAIVDMKGDIEAETVYNGRVGYRPLTIACNEGALELMEV